MNCVTDPILRKLFVINNSKKKQSETTSSVIVQIIKIHELNGLIN